MPNMLRNTMAVIAGIVIGGAFNMAIVTVGPMLIPPPPGVDVTDVESLSRSIHLLQPQHFLTPFLAHALGTLVGATVTWLVAVSHRMRLAYVIGGFFLIGGIAAVMMIPAPTWFIVLDLLVAYIPMAWLGSRIGAAIRPAPLR